MAECVPGAAADAAAGHAVEEEDVVGSGGCRAVDCVAESAGGGEGVG